MSVHTDPDAVVNLTGGDDDILDLSGVPEDRGGFAPIPAGKYQAVCDSVEYGTSASSGNKMLTWKFVVDYEGQARYFWHYTPFGEKSLPKLRSTIVAVNPEVDLSHFHPRNDLIHFQGRGATLVIGVKKYQEEMRNEVKKVMPPEGDGLSFLDEL